MARKPERSASTEVYSITAAHRSHAEEMRERMAKYAVSMTIRTLCFVLLVVVHNPSRWVFAVAAVVLPYIAVIVANAGRERTRTPTTLIGHAEHARLGAAPAPASAPASAPQPGAPGATAPRTTAPRTTAPGTTAPGTTAPGPRVFEPTVIHVPEPTATPTA